MPSLCKVKPILHDMISPDIAEGFQRNLVQIFITGVRGQRLRSRPERMLWWQRHAFWQCRVRARVFIKFAIFVFKKRKSTANCRSAATQYATVFPHNSAYKCSEMNTQVWTAALVKFFQANKTLVQVIRTYWLTACVQDLSSVRCLNFFSSTQSRKHS